MNTTYTLTETEFKSTFSLKMTDVTYTAEPVVDIWNYVSLLVNQNIVSNHVYENNLVENVYRNDAHTFDHVLLPTAYPTVFITIVIDLKNERIFGHFKLDLNEKYGD